MLKRNIATVVIAGLFAGTAGIANANDSLSYVPSHGANVEITESWGQVTYLFNPSAAQLAVERSTGSFLPGNSGVYRPFGKVEYLFKQNAGAAAQQQIASASSTFPSAWTQWID